MGTGPPTPGIVLVTSTRYGEWDGAAGAPGEGVPCACWGGGGAEAGHPQAATCLALGALSHLKLWLALSPRR